MDCKRGQSTASCRTVSTNLQPTNIDKQIQSCQLVTNHLKQMQSCQLVTNHLKQIQSCQLVTNHFMQVIAAVDGRLVSIYDGATQYKLGQTLHAKRGGAAWAPLDACYFAFPTMQQVHSLLKTCCQTCFLMDWIKKHAPRHMLTCIA